MNEPRHPASGSVGSDTQVGDLVAKHVEKIGGTRAVKTNSGKDKSKVFVVDDHPLVRDFVRNLVNFQPDLTICGEAEEAGQALRAIAQLRPQLVVTDLSIKDSHGLDLLKDIKLQFPELPVLVLSVHDESVFAEHVLRAGARGYISKQRPADEILSAMRKVLGGGIYLSEEVSEKIVQKSVCARQKSGVAPVDLLSSRELQILQLIGEGRTSHQIAVILHLDARTIGTYRVRIREKLNIEDPPDLLSYAIQWAQAEAHSTHRIEK